MGRGVGVLVGFVLGVSVSSWAASPRYLVSLGDAEVRVSPPGSATIALLAKGEQAFVGRLTVQPGVRIPAHRDETEEFIHVLSGGGSMTIDGAPLTVKVGDTVFMPAGSEVTFTNGPEASEVLQVFAGPGPAAKYDAWTPAGR